MTAGIIIQARLTSERFPNKILGNLRGKLVIEWVIEACVESKLPIVIAIPINKTNDGLEFFLNYLFEKRGWRAIITIYRGQEEDCLSRFIFANAGNDFDPIIRVCGDSPYLTAEDLKIALDLYNKRKYYTRVNHVEVFGEDELEYADEHDPHIESRQHVLGRFGMDTVDYPEDLDRFNKNMSEDKDPTLLGRLRLWSKNGR